MRRVILLVLGCLALNAVAADVADAQRRRRGAGTGRMADRWQARPLTLPKATLRFDIHEDDWDRTWGGFVFRSIDPDGGGPADREGFFFFNFGMAGGILDDLELGGLIIPMRLSPNADYLNPQAYLLWRFLRGPVQIGMEGRIEFPADHRGWGQFGIPFLIAPGSVVRMDFGFFIRTDFDNAGLLMPFRLGFQVSNPFFLGIDTGLFVPDFDDVDVPIGMFFGYTVTSRDPVVDFLWGFRFIDVGRRRPADEFQLWFSARFYVFL